MKKILVASTIFLGLLVVILASIIVGMLIPRPGAGNFAPGGAPQAAQQQRPTLPGKKPSQYKIGIPYDQAMKANKPFVVLFYADWCPHCMAFMPIYEKLYKKHKKSYNFVMLNAEAPENAKLTKDYAITAYPTVYISDPVKMNREFINNSLFGSVDGISAELDKYLKK